MGHAVTCTVVALGLQAEASLAQIIEESLLTWIRMKLHGNSVCAAQNLQRSGEQCIVFATLNVNLQEIGAVPTDSFIKRVQGNARDG